MWCLKYCSCIRPLITRAKLKILKANTNAKHNQKAIGTFGMTANAVNATIATVKLASIARHRHSGLNISSDSSTTTVIRNKSTIIITIKL